MPSVELLHSVEDASEHRGAGGASNLVSYAVVHRVLWVGALWGAVVRRENES